jgi:hypothetical protein
VGTVRLCGLIYHTTVVLMASTVRNSNLTTTDSINYGLKNKEFLAELMKPTFPFHGSLFVKNIT